MHRCRPPFTYQLLRVVCAVFIFAGTLIFNIGACADEALPSNLDASIGRGLDFLAAQQAADGSFGTAQKPAITGLALMSFLASGHAPDLGKFGAAVRGASDYLLSQAQADGTFTRNDKPMYQQGIVTLALAEAYGLEPNEPQRKRMATVLAKSVEVILKAQDVKKQEQYAGGWRYEANSADSDLSLCGWNALALRACQDVGIAVPKSAARQAVKFVLKCYSADAKGFAYQPGGAPAAGTTGLGILCLHLLDDGAGRKESEAAMRTLEKHPIDDQTQFPYYGLYYATQAANQAGEPSWSAITKATFDKLFKAQQPDGGWPDVPSESGGTGRLYTTSMALLTLSIPYRLLPAYQR